MTAFREQFSTGHRDTDKKLDISPSESSIIVAILSAGTVIGALLAAPAGDSLGRRMSLILGVAVFAFGAVFQVCAQDIPMLLVGRYVGLIASRRRAVRRDARVDVSI
jgi:predicted MFS family arabinose efflux permease